MLLDPEESQLVLVDYQQRLMPAIADGAAVLANAVRLARIAQLLHVPCWGTEENPAGTLPTRISMHRPVRAEVPPSRGRAARRGTQPGLNAS